MEDYNKAIELNPQNADFYAARARVKYLLSDFTGALKDYNTAISNILEPRIAPINTDIISHHSKL